jgi:hypothetical protein
MLSTCILISGEDSKSKAESERLICGANDESFRTGTIRPGNAIYGQKSDPVLGSLLQLGESGTWMPHIVQSVSLLGHRPITNLA